MLRVGGQTSEKDGRVNGEVATVASFQAGPVTGPRQESVRSLMDVPLRQTVELERIEAPDDEVEPLLERGILPGCRLRRVRNSPSGDPIVSVEGTLLALRRECAAQLFVREVAPASSGESPAEILATRTA